MPFTQSDMPKSFSDVLKRRFFSVSGDVRKAAFLTRGIKTSFWLNGPSVHLLIGDSDYQRSAMAVARRYGTPLPGISSSPPAAKGIFHFGRGNRHSSIKDGTFADEKAGSVFSFEPGASFLTAAVNIEVVTITTGKIHYKNQIAFIACLSEEMTMTDASVALETILIREIGEHIQQVPLNAVA